MINNTTKPHIATAISAIIAQTQADSPANLLLNTPVTAPVIPLANAGVGVVASVVVGFVVV